MNDIHRYIIPKESSLTEALKKLNEIPDVLTLFVVNENMRVLGSLTDGDIRRGIIKGLSLKDDLGKFCNRNFKYLSENKIDFAILKLFRKKRLKVVPLLNEDKQIIKLFDFTKIKTLLPIDVVLMAGGAGKRLRPMTAKTPKPLLKVGPKPIIDYNVERLVQCGVEDIYISVHYLKNKIKKYFSGSGFNTKIHMIEEETPLGTFGAVRKVNDFSKDYILVMNSDLLTNIDFQDMFEEFTKTEADMIVASVPYNVNLPYAVLEMSNNQVLSFHEKPSYTYYANAGIYIIKKELIQLIPENTPFNATDMMKKVLNNKYRLTHYPITGYWLDIGKPEDFEKAQKDIAHINFD